jgi:3-oxoacyl-[acyl-carrier protein] reductase
MSIPGVPVRRSYMGQTQLLDNKNAVVYGAGGMIGGGIARAFAREGARVFLAGRTLAPLAALAADIGDRAEVAQVDALDEDAVAAHLDDVVAKAGSIDISMNAIGIRGELQGTPAVDLALDDFLAPVVTGARAHFVTGREAGRRMTNQGWGAILLLTASASYSKLALRTPFPMGGFGAACAAIEGLMRSFASEFGPHGVRVNCMRLEGTAELIATEVGTEAEALFVGPVKQESMLRRLTTVADGGNAACYLVSDLAGAVTGTIANVTSGTTND